MPLAIRYGVPMSIFWSLNPKRLEPWQRHYEYSEQLRRDEQDYVAWLSGQYVHAAICAAFEGKKSPYPTEPSSVAHRREEQAEANQIAADRFAAFAMAFNAGFRKRQEAKQQQQNQ